MLHLEANFWLMICIVFEGAAHPYKGNLIKIDGRVRKRELVADEEALKKDSI